ncbi:spectrin beta chain, non-erythrocytic 1 isoform X3 [Planococcus citri]|uniref:spectrin beta chain, non-erythrocytic 1 isoform X3 n=1 Tax=Planococcus citri TaxID=170843 RepID=UPI0031F99451
MFFAANDNIKRHYERLVEFELQYEQRGGYLEGPPDEMTQREDVLKFEQGRIRALQEERLHIQKKTFTKWMNSFLQKVRMEVDDLFMDLADGKKLLKLLEIISGEKLGKPNNGKMRVHKVENVNKSLAFLRTKVRLESIGAEDIVDGNPRLILGLIWTIILRFQIQEIEIDVDEENESSEKKSAKDALLLWCQRKTAGYSGVSIQDFTGSWRSGLGFNALIHAHRPELINFNLLNPTKHIDNLNNAFDVAHNELGIPRLLDAEDVDTNRPDEKSIMTYVASYYHTFARMKNEQKSGRRIANIVGQMMDADKKKIIYEKLTSDLLNWIKRKIKELEDRNFPNSLEGIQKELLRFKQYRTVEKPPKYKERSEIEALYFHINTQLKSLNQPAFTPQDGQLIHDLERSWEELERAEHTREVALRQELLRQERLEQLNYKFEKKSVLREGYLKEMIHILTDPIYGSNLSQVDATVKKHEAISVDIMAREERFNDLNNMSEELVRERYHGAERVKKRVSEVTQKWQDLLKLLEKHRANLNMLCTLMSMLREIDTVLSTITELEGAFKSEDVGPHLLAVEDLLQKHSLMEMQTTALGENVRKLARQAQQYISAGHKEAPLLQNKVEQLHNAYNRLLDSSKDRRVRLEDARNFSQFIQDHEDEEAWLVEKQFICKAGIFAKDLRAVLSLQQKHKTLIDEMKAREAKSELLRSGGEQLITAKHPSSDDIQSRIKSLQQHWKVLRELADNRRKQLEEAMEAYQFYADANEAESWLNERLTLVNSKDYGEDEPTAQSLLQRHRDLFGELKAYQGDVQSLNSQAERLMTLGISSLQLTGESAVPENLEPVEEWVNETQLVPQQVWEEEPVERIEYRTVMEERQVPQVKSLYPFSGQGMLMVKGEVMFLLNKTNQDWWSVRKANGQDGFVPANYVREIEPKVMQVAVRKPEHITTTKRVLKTKLVKQVVPVKKTITRKSNNKKKPVVDDSLNVDKRIKKINATYTQLLDLAQKRHTLLEDSIRLFGFYRECEDFEKWIKDKEKLLRSEDKNDSVETAKRKYEKFLTDLSASNKRIEALDAAVDDFSKRGHSQLEKVKARQKQIHQMWDHLNWMKAQKERNLEGASSVEFFHRTCDEAKDWMIEKMNQLDIAELGADLKTVQALQRRHQNLERELAPVEEKVNRVNLLANSVKSSYPNEKGNVNARLKEIQDLWDKVKTKAVERRSRLENAVGHQIFMNSSKNLLNWVSIVKDALNADETARDVVTAESLLKKHQELYDDINAHQDEFTEVEKLGAQLIQRNPALKDVKERIAWLNAEQQAVMRGWNEKGDWLKQCLDLQILNKEADHIDATTSSHEAFLEFTDLGGSIDDVETLLKRHEDFENTLYAQDERLKLFSEMADKLISAGHYDSKGIDERRLNVLNRRKAVKESAAKRRVALIASRNFQCFRADVDDLNCWLADKLKTAGDESYRDLSNIERKLQKHEAFERELRANEGQLRSINKAGQTLVSEGNYRKAEVKEILNDLNKTWSKLVDLCTEKGRRLRQASAQHTYNRTLEDAKLKLDEFEKNLQSTQVGTDLRHCKQLLKKHQVTEAEIKQWQQKVDDLVTVGQEMAQEGHFDANNILKASEECQDKFTTLKEPLKLRQEALQEALRFHKFGFELETELGWIREHLPLASSEVLGNNLYQAQSLHKKHKKLEAEIRGHQQMIDKTLASGEALIHQKHPETKQVTSLCTGLQDAWQDLKMKAAERSRKLDLSLKAQQFFFEANEVESWLTEKNDILKSTDYGRDRDAASKLLTKHKALELELDTYSGIINEMGHVAGAMINSKHPDWKAIASKQQAITQQLKNLQKLAGTRQQNLMDSICRHEYMSESDELEQWIKENMQVAASEDYGQDYEHLQLLQNKFDDLKHRVEAGADRFNQCEELAKKLIASESPHTAIIEKRQEQLRESWKQLLHMLESREQRLNAAGEIHRFHRDVADALSRTHDKDAAISDDLGRDLNSVLTLIRKHEGFENDLVALEAQLQILVEDAVRLQSLYPGNNASHIANQQNIVVSSWTALQERSAHRREALQASCDLHRFLAQVRDLTNWASGLRAAMMTEEKVRDAASAQILKAEHEATKAEIEARENSFKSVIELGEALIQGGHYAAPEIQEKFNHLLEERQSLHTAWQHKKVHLDQLIDLHFFLRDAKQIDTLCGAQEAALSSSEFGTSVDEVSVLVKKHNDFEKLMATQEEKVVQLQEHGDKLLAQNHFESPLIAKRMSEVIARREHVKELCHLRKIRLEDSLLHAQFTRDVAEAVSWIDEKSKKLEKEVGKTEVTSLEDKIKKLQKHQAFQAELVAHEGKIKSIQQNGEVLLAKKHKASREIKSQLDHLLTLWRNLLQESNNRGRGLEEAQDILEFNNQVDKIESWMRDKEVMVQAGDMGRDYEHCLALQKKLDDVDRVDDSRIKAINALADKLIRQGRSDSRSIHQRRENFNTKWRALQGALSEYKEHLAGALEIHAFNRDIDDTAQRVGEKANVMSSEDTGRDLAAVESLQRKQEALERDMTAIEGKLKEHDLECRKLVQKYPDMSSPIRAKLSELQDAWRNLLTLSRSRKDALNMAHTNHKFIADLKELEIWVADTIKKMDSSELPTNIPEAKAALELHHERKAEIDGRQESFKILKEAGLKLTPVRKDELNHLEELRRTLNSAWEERKTKLNQALQWQLFKEQAEQAESWLASKEAFLNNDDLGESLSGVEILLRKHETFEKTVTAQLSRIDDLEKFAMEILADHHYNSSGIQNKLQSVCSRRDKLKESSAARRKRLNDSKQLQLFLRNMYEVEGWLLQKQQIACDESYRDPTNLQSKIQKHAAFESELIANRNRLNAVTAEGESLISAGHFAGPEIRARLDKLETEWRKLQEASALKRERLNDAYQAMVFSRTLEDLEAWIEEVEAQLQSEDHGKDLASVANLLKRHSLLENDVHSHGEACQQLKDTATTFQTSNHFMKDEIQERANSVIQRYHSLQEPMQIRRDNLEDALLLYQFSRDIEDELQWLFEKEPFAASSDYGTSLNTVQKLQKKQQALEAELLSHEPVINALSSRAQQMIRSGHFASQRIDALLSDVMEKFAHIKELTNTRKLKLLDALESQMFFDEANEARVWLKEKRPIVTSLDYGKDEDSVQSLIKKLEAVERELSAFQHTVGRLSSLSQSLIDRSHFDSKNITKMQSEIEKELNELQGLCKLREARLLESRKLYRFLREAEEVAEWINDQTAVAASEDYGRDVEHVELLIQAFDNFLAGLSGSEGRVLSCLETGKVLVTEGNREKEKITMKLEEIQQLWDDLKELSHARQEALAGAKQVHVFDRTADETISWIQEKDALLMAEDYDNNLETIQGLVRKHEGFQADLAAVKEQVEAVVEEAGRLSGLFPDARDHIEVKHEETLEAWTQLLERSEQRKDKLHQTEKLQAYFDEYTELMAWINEVMAKITSAELAQDVDGAEKLLQRHEEHRAEITSRQDAFNRFYATGNDLIRKGHFLGNDIQEKIKTLELRYHLLNETWKSRRVLYEQNLDTQIFKREAEQLENWVLSREPMLHDEKLGDSIHQVEELIRKHEDFEKTIEAQEEKCNALKRITLLEKAFVKQKEIEKVARIAEKDRLEKEKLEARKRREVQRITDERRREDRRRVDPRSLKEDMNGEDEFDSDIRLNSSASPVAYHKGGAISSLFGDRIRKDIKRAESMKADYSKKPRRTPSFTTRRRTQSFRKLQKLEQLDQLPPVEIQGLLDRKHELQSGGKKAPVRSWKTLYTVLCGQLLCFFKDQDDFLSSKAATPPISIYKAQCKKAEDYTKRKHVFRLCCEDGSEFLFLANSEKEMEDWVNKIQFHAQLPPSLQLLSYDDTQKELQSNAESSPAVAHDTSSSSRESTPEVQRRKSGPNVSRNSINSNDTYHNKTAITAPRSAPPPVPARTSSAECLPVTLRNKQNNDVMEPSARPHSYQIQQSRVIQNGNSDWRRSSENTYDLSPTNHEPPPLPTTAPPLRNVHNAKDAWQNDYRHNSAYNVGVIPSKQAMNNSNSGNNRASTLPPYISPPVGANIYQNVDPIQRPPSESSSESEHPASITRKDKRSSVLTSLFRKKKATHL